jgi:hypothetical protein
MYHQACLSCSGAVHTAISRIHRNVGDAYIWQLEGRGRLPKDEFQRISKTIDKAVTLINQLEAIGLQGSMPGMRVSHDPCVDILGGSRLVLRLSHEGRKKATIEAWQSLKKLTLDRSGFWEEICVLGEEIDARTRGAA